MSSNRDLPEIPKLRKPAKPWELLNPEVGRVADEVQKERMSICNDCPFLMKISKTCRKCGCFMTAKTTLPNAFCPIGKWDEAPVENEDHSH